MASVLNESSGSDEEEEEMLAAAVAVVAAVACVEAEPDRLRRPTMPYVLRRRVYGAFHSLVQELADEDPGELRVFLRLTGNNFDTLLHLVGPYIQKQDTSFKESIPPEERLAATLHFLSTGGPKKRLFYLFRIPVSTLQYIIPETCKAIFNALKDSHLKFPSTEEEWKAIQCQFYERWNFPMCMGAIDGKHVEIKKPAKSGSLYYNYLKYHSIVLLALVDADYKFMFVDIGTPGRFGDATIWNRSDLKKALENEQLGAPAPLIPPRGHTAVPSLFLGDSAFALSTKLMKPYPGKNSTVAQDVFNYRLSRARRVVENAFGILASRFAVFQGAMSMHPQTCVDTVKACVVLHNYLRSIGDNDYCGPGALDHENGPNHTVVYGDWRAEVQRPLQGLQVCGGARHGQQVTNGKGVRDEIKDFFMGPGALRWQERAARKL